MPLFAQEIIAHRGASYRAPENTLAAVKLGYESGAEAVEIDIHLTNDQRIVVIHDKDTRRTAGGKNLQVKEAHSDELRQLEVGSWKDEKYRGEKIPFLEEVLPLVPEGQKLVIELKSGADVLPYLVQQIEESGVADRLLLISFSREAIVQAKSMMPTIPAYWLLHNYNEHSLDEAIEIAKAANLEGLDVHYRLVDEAFMQKVQDNQLDVYVYTVDKPRTARKLADLGVKGITTNRPKWLRDQLESEGKDSGD